MYIACNLKATPLVVHVLFETKTIIIIITIYKLKFTLSENFTMHVICNNNELIRTKTYQMMYMYLYIEISVHARYSTVVRAANCS